MRPSLMLLISALRSASALQSCRRLVARPALSPLFATTSASRQAKRAAQFTSDAAPKLKAAAKPPAKAPAAPPADAPAVEGTAFASLPLPGKLARNVLKQLGEDAAMTPIQELAFGPASDGDDIVARAQTGTGKTLAFLVPSLKRLLEGDLLDREKRRPRVVVLSPTRELAQQIHAQAERLAAGTPAKCCCVVGGTSKGADVRKLKAGVDVLVATPGRLCDLLGGDERLLRGAQTLVLDEGDRLLDEGFERQLTQIVAASSRSRQTLCFSATMPADLDRMLRSGAVKRDHARLDATGLGSTVADATAARVELSRLSLPRAPTRSGPSRTRSPRTAAARAGPSWARRTRASSSCTARAAGPRGAGEALLVLEHWEQGHALGMLGDVPGLGDADPAAVLPAGDDAAASVAAMKAIARGVRDKAYVAWLGHTNAKAKALGWSKQELVDRANAMAVDDYKLVDIPALTPRAVGFMGLKQVRNIRVEKKAPPQNRRSQGNKPQRKKAPPRRS
ncbi:helicase [Aureococcus anophagefferens]|nr:helicase [Aureococcus anophagefferens]